MKKKYDIIIIGGGPCGLSCAAELADSDLDVLLIDNKSVNDRARFDVKGTSYKFIHDMSLDKSILSKQNHFGMYSRNEYKIFRYNKSRLCVVELKKALEILKKRTKCKFGNSTVLRIKKNNNSIILLDDKDQNYETSLLIDCSGNSFVAANSLKLKKPEVLYHCVSLVLENCIIPSDKMNEISFYMDMSVCNSAVWFYPIDKSHCQVGLGEMAPYKIASQDQLLDSIKKVKELYPFKDMIYRSKIREDSMVFGHNPVIQPMKKMQLDNLMFAGDCAGMSSPLVGEGFRLAIIGGKNAGIVSKKAFQNKDLSVESLKEHEQMWWKRFGKYYIWTIIMRHLICKYFEPGDWDKIINQLKKVDEKEFWEIINSRLTFKRFKKLISFKMVIDILSDDLLKLIPRFALFRKRYGTSSII